MTVLLGRNGAGKTTTLRTIMGLWKPSRGQVTFAGKPIGGLAAPDDRARRHRLCAGDDGRVLGSHGG